jgi:hypothetical protein
VLSQRIRHESQAGRSNDQQAGAPQLNIELLRRYAYYTTSTLQHTITNSVSRSLLDRHILTAHPIRELLPLGLWFPHVSLCVHLKPNSPCPAINVDHSSPRQQVPWPQYIQEYVEIRKKLTRISQNPYRSSRLRYGLRAPPSRSISPAHSRQLTGLSFCALSTSPTETTRTEKRVSMIISCGRAVDARLLKRTVCSWAE